MRLVSREDCWLYAGFIDKTGYSLFSYTIAGKYTSTTAHKAMYEHMNGKVPAGLHLDHLCKTPRCVNPSHLEPVTQAENNRRVIRKSTLKIVVDCPHCLQSHTIEPKVVKRAYDRGYWIGRAHNSLV